MILLITILIGLIIISIPIGFTFGVYYLFRIKGGRIGRRISFGVFLLTTIFTLFITVYLIANNFGMGPDYETVDIPQKIGGTLRCESVFRADHKIWNYDVDYTYFQENGDSIVFPSGSFYITEWYQDNQIYFSRDWYLLYYGAGRWSYDICLKNQHTDSVKLVNVKVNDLLSHPLWRSSIPLDKNKFEDYEFSVDTLIGNRLVMNYIFYENSGRYEDYYKGKLSYYVDFDKGELELVGVGDISYDGLVHKEDR